MKKLLKRIREAMDIEKVADSLKDFCINNCPKEQNNCILPQVCKNYIKGKGQGCKLPEHPKNK